MMNSIKNFLLLSFSLLWAADDFPYSGVVKDTGGVGIENVEIGILNSEIKTWTTADGRFTASVVVAEPKTGDTFGPDVSFRGNLLHLGSLQVGTLNIAIFNPAGQMLWQKDYQTTGSLKVTIPQNLLYAEHLFVRLNDGNQQYHLILSYNSPEHLEKSSIPPVRALRSNNLLPAPTQDSLCFKKFGYLSDTLVADSDPMEIILQPNPSAPCELTYEQSKGNSWHFVGQSPYVNTYRGVYWVGKSKTICRADVNLNFEGDISSYNYKVTVWEVDVANDLELIRQIATSDTMSGALVQAGGSWVSFPFKEPVPVISGKTAILISRADTSQYSIVNMLRVSNNYDMDDEENDQFNVHYSHTRLAGRKPGDEDQPEPFAFDIKLYGVDQLVDPALEFPAAPMNIVATSSSAGEVDLVWDDFNVAVEIENYRVYQYNPANAELSFMAETATKSYKVTGLTGGIETHFVVTGVSIQGNESYHTRIASITP